MTAKHTIFVYGPGGARYRGFELHRTYLDSPGRPRLWRTRKAGITMGAPTRAGLVKMIDEQLDKVVVEPVPAPGLAPVTPWPFKTWNNPPPHGDADLASRLKNIKRLVQSAKVAPVGNVDAILNQIAYFANC